MLKMEVFMVDPLLRWNCDMRGMLSRDTIQTIQCNIPKEPFT
jgi:hypothetical protein